MTAPVTIADQRGSRSASVLLGRDEVAADCRRHAHGFETLAKAERSHANKFQKTLDAIVD